MRIHKISLKNVRGVAARTVEFPETGLSVLAGDNEVGKTTLIEALDLLLTTKDSSKGAKVRAIAPVDQDVPSEISAEISSGDYRFELFKQFNKKPATSLRIIAPSPANSTGDAAHERANQILDATRDKTLWDALRMMQSMPLSAESFASSSALATALDRAAGNQSAGVEDDALLSRITETANRYFTATGKPTGELAKAQAELAEAQANAELTQLAVTEVAEQVDKLDAAKSRQEAAAVRLTNSAAAAEELAEQLRQVQERAAEVSTAEQELKDAQNRQKLAALSLERAQDVSARRAKLAGLIEQLRADGERLAADVSLKEQSRSDAAEARQRAQEGWNSAKASLAQAAAARKRQELVDHLAAVEEQLATIDAARTALAEAEKAHSANPVTRELAEQIRQAEAHRLTATSHLASRSTHVALTRLQPDVRVTLDGEAVRKETQDLDIFSEQTLQVPGVISLQFTPAGSVAELAQRKDDAEAALAELLAEAGCSSVAESSQRLAEKERLGAELDAAKAQFSGALQGQDTEHLRSQRQALSEQVTADENAENAAQPKADGGIRTESSDLDEEAARAAESTSAQAFRDAERAWDACQSALELAQYKLTENHSDLQARQAEAQSQAPAATEEPDLAALRAEFDAAHTAAEQAAAGAEEAAAGFDPAILASLEAQSGNAEAAVADRRREIEELKVTITELGAWYHGMDAPGRQERAQGAANALEHAADTHDSVRRRALAARVLHTAFTQAKAAAQRRYVAPFEEKINAIGRMVHGSGFAVHVGENLSIENRTLAGRTLPFDDLSAGTREQLALITRLACAALVDVADSVPVLIDDALGHADPHRLRLMGVALREAAKSAQVIVLTCYPERFVNIGDAEVTYL